MKVLILLLSFFIFGFTKGPKVKASENYWKYTVHLKGPKSYCSGVILDKDIILTAAHCMYPTNKKYFLDTFLYS